MEKQFEKLLKGLPLTKPVKDKLIEEIDKYKGGEGDNPTECELKHVYAVSDTGELIEIETSNYQGIRGYISNYNVIIGCNDDVVPNINIEYDDDIVSNINNISENIIFIIDMTDVHLFKSLKNFSVISTGTSIIINNFTSYAIKEELINTYWVVHKDLPQNS